MNFIILIIFSLFFESFAFHRGHIASAVRSIYDKIDNSTEIIENELKFMEKSDRPCLIRELGIEKRLKNAEIIEIDENFIEKNGKLLEALDYASQFCLMMKTARVDLSSYKSKENEEIIDCLKMKLSLVEPYSRLVESIDFKSLNFSDSSCLNSTDQCRDVLHDYGNEEKTIYEKMIEFSCSFADFLQANEMKRLCWMATILANAEYSDDFVQTELDEMMAALFSIQRNKLECIIDDLEWNSE